VTKTGQHAGGGYDWNFDFETSAQYSDPVTLHAASTISDNSIGASGTVVYQWETYDVDGDPVYGLGEDFTFTPSANIQVNDIADVTLYVTHYYTANGVTNIKTAKAEIDVKIKQKKVNVDDVDAPVFNTN
jgi:hypothetical protein